MFADVRAIEGDVDVMGELERRFLLLVSQRDREAVSKQDKLGQMLVSAKDELLALREASDATLAFCLAAAQDNFEDEVARLTQAPAVCFGFVADLLFQQLPISPPRSVQNGHSDAAAVALEIVCALCVHGLGLGARSSEGRSRARARAVHITFHDLRQAARGHRPDEGIAPRNDS